MNQTIRSSIFETNSSSIHCLTIEKYNELEPDFSDLIYDIKPFRNKDLKYFGNKFTTVEDKLRYLWTIRMLYDESAPKPDYEYDKDLNYNPWEEREWVDEFTSMLKSIFPNVNFIETDIDYLEDYEYLREDPKMLDEYFIKHLVNEGIIVFTERDYNSWEEEYFIEDLRIKKYQNQNNTIWSEG